MADKPHFQVHTQHMNKNNSMRWYRVQCTCHGHFIYFWSQVTSASLSGHTHSMMNFHQKHWVWSFLLSPLHYSTSQLSSTLCCSYL